MEKARIIVFIIVASCFIWPLNGSQGNKTSVQVEIEQLNLEILHEELMWRAGETSLSRLDIVDKRKRLGRLLFFDLPGQEIPFVQVQTDLPRILDWRNRGGMNYMTVVKDQGSCGACWAYSTIAVIEALYNIQTGVFSTQVTPVMKTSILPEVSYRQEKINKGPRILALDYPDLSEQDLISCSEAGDCSGGYEYMALNYIHNQGIVSEDCFPYAGDFVNCELCADWERTITRIKDWSWVTKATVDKQLVKMVLQSGPLIFYMEVYSDFYHYRSGIYEPVASASYEGAHSVAAVGYDEKNDYWICKNSWGKNWGENGYFRIRFDTCATGRYVMKAGQVIINNSPPVLSPIIDQIVKEGQELTFQASASDPDGDRLEFSAADLPVGASLTLTGLFQWKPDYHQSGEYWVKITVTDKVLKRSKIVKIVVVNVKKGKGKY